MIPFFVFIFILGLVMGSFANVCIYRIPLERSVVTPRSSCVSCGTMIAWHENIPVLSYLFLKGRCSHCHEPISVRYPLIEITTAFLFLFVSLRYYAEPLYLSAAIAFTFLLIVISGIDYSHQIIPDIFSVILIIGGLLFSFFNMHIGTHTSTRFLNALAGGASGAAALLCIGYIGTKIFHKEAMGGGDVKLLAGIGTLFGIQKIFLILFMSAVLGSVVGIVLILTKRINRKEYIPFGPFIAASAYLALFLPDTVDIL